jgi:hypothetical protein
MLLSVPCQPCYCAASSYNVSTDLLTVAVGDNQYEDDALGHFRLVQAWV